MTSRSKAESAVSVDEMFDGPGFTLQDKQDMMLVGKTPRLNRIFGFLSMLGFTTTIMCAWAAVFYSNFTALLDGGPVTMLWGSVFSWAGALLTGASMGELVSMMPTAGGQYHWTAALAPKSISVFTSWLVGWLAVLGWLSTLCAAPFLTGTMVQALYLLDHPSIPFERWQGTLLLWAVLLICFAVNTVGARSLPKIEGFILIFYVIGFFAIIIPLVVLAPHHDASFVFTNFTNSSGYSSGGLAFFVGLIATNVPFIGYDGPVHMVEEVQNGSTTVPWCIISTVILSGILNFATMVVFLFCLGNPTDVINAALQTPGGLDFLEVFMAATRSYVGTSFMTAIIIVLLAASSFCCLASASRQVWAFARDRGLPFSNYLSQINTFCGIPMPLRTVAFSCVISALIGLINIASTYAFNAILSLALAGLFISYLVPILLILMKRIRGDEIAWGPWKLGRAGIPINILSAVYLIISTVFSFFPPALPVTAVSMNWSSVVFVGAICIGLVYYGVRGRHIYSGPVTETGAMSYDMNERNKPSP